MTDTTHAALEALKAENEALREALEVSSRTHQTAMEQAMKARVLDGGLHFTPKRV